MKFSINEAIVLQQALVNLDGYMAGDKKMIFEFGGATRVKIAKNRKILGILVDKINKERGELITSANLSGGEGQAVFDKIRQDETKILSRETEVDLAKLTLAELNLDQNTGITATLLVMMDPILEDL